MMMIDPTGSDPGLTEILILHQSLGLPGKSFKL